MTREAFAARLVAGSLALLAWAGGGLAADAAKPNVLILYVDDMGYGQPGCYGGTLATTPHIDALAAGGMRFTDGYVSACICSPSRVGLMTGRYQARTGHDANGGRPGRELAKSETTLAERMKAAGYATGIVGKWHLGTTSAEYLPTGRGFDTGVGTTGNLGEGNGPLFYEGGTFIDDLPGAPVTSPVYAEKAAAFIEGHRAEPWLLYVAFNAVHSPIVATEAALAEFVSLPDRRAREYAALVRDLDDAVGTILGKVHALGLDEQTLVFLISDNGGANPLAEMGGLRGRKWLVYEGGIRVPFLARWTGHIPAGTVSHEPVIQLDVMPTALAAAGRAVDPAWGLDGVDLLPLLTGRAETLAPRDLFWRFGVQHAVRRGDYKLVKAGLNEPTMLVNLKTDPGERTDLSKAEPEKAAELQAAFDRWDAAMVPPRWEDKRWNDGNQSPRPRRGQRAAD